MSSLRRIEPARLLAAESVWWPLVWPLVLLLSAGLMLVLALAVRLALALTQTARLTLTLAAPLHSSSLSQSPPMSPIRSMPVFSSQFLSALFPLSSQIQPPQEQSSQVQPSQIPPSEVQSSTMQSAQSLQ